jgi:hypothetical protein
MGSSKELGWCCRGLLAGLGMHLLAGVPGGSVQAQPPSGPPQR